MDRRKEKKRMREKEERKREQESERKKKRKKERDSNTNPNHKPIYLPERGQSYPLEFLQGQDLQMILNALHDARSGQGLRFKGQDVRGRRGKENERKKEGERKRNKIEGQRMKKGREN